MSEASIQSPVPAPERSPAQLTRSESFSDRLNPVLVKEMRQALRGKAFRSSYLFVLLTASLLGFVVITANAARPGDDSLGAQFFLPLYGTLALGLCTLLPITCFQSMSAEWEGSTHDLLVLSELTPARILRGKLLTALAQGLLFASAFLPLLALAALMPGIDLVRAGVLLGVLPIASGSLCALALSIAALSKSGGYRGFVLGGLSLILIGCAWVLVVFAGAAVRGGLVDREFDLATLLAFAAIGLVGVYLYLTALGPLSHPEENASTPVRVYLTGAVIVALAAILGIRWFWVRDDEFLSAITMAFLVGGFFPLLGLVTERKALGRRVAREIQRRKTPVLFAPWLPGRDRALLLSALVTLPVALTPLGYRLFEGKDFTHFDLIPLGIWPYLMMYLALAPIFLGRFCETIGGRWRARVLVVSIAVGAALLPTLGGALLDIDGLESGIHLGNPFWIPLHLNRIQYWSGSEPVGQPPYLLLGVVATLFTALVAGDLLRGWTAVAGARRTGSDRNG